MSPELVAGPIICVGKRAAIIIGRGQASWIVICMGHNMAVVGELHRRLTAKKVVEIEFWGQSKLIFKISL